MWHMLCRGLRPWSRASDEMMPQGDYRCCSTGLACHGACVGLCCSAVQAVERDRGAHQQCGALVAM